MQNTQILLLQPISIVSETWLFELFSNKELLQFTDTPIIESISDIETIYTYFSVENKLTWIITLNNTNTSIGFISALLTPKHKTASLTFVLLPKFHKQGYMFNALSQCISLLFTNHSIFRIEAQVYTQNIPSIKLLESLGFVNEGTLRKNFMINGKLEDSYMFAKLKE